jgi:hypothetical protein
MQQYWVRLVMVNCIAAQRRHFRSFRCAGLKKLFCFLTRLFAVAFPRQGFLHATLFTRLEIEGVTFDFFDNVLLLDLSLKAAQCVFKGLALLNSNFCQKKYTSRHPHMGSFRILQIG